MKLKIAESCGSCIHTKPQKKPREHAAHYEVSKTERWCFKHNCHVTRETVCEDGYEGVNRAAKTGLTRTKKYNDRIIAVKEVMELLKGKPLILGDYVYFIKNNWLHYVYGDSLDDIENKNYSYRMSTKDNSCDYKLDPIKKFFENDGI